MRLKAVTAYMKEVIRTTDFLFYFGRQKLIKIMRKHNMRIFSFANTGEHFLCTFNHITLHNKCRRLTVML